MSLVASEIPGYAYGSPVIAPSPVTFADLALLRVTVGLTLEDEARLRRAGDVLADQTAAIVGHWRSTIIASIPHLARHSRGVDGQPLPDYLAASNLRFRQWILDICRRPYDQDWLNYQHEIARRHTSSLKNRTDGVASTPFVPLRDVLAFVAVMNQTIKPYMNAGGHAPADVEAMHAAWCRSLQLQVALWAKAYLDPALPGVQW